MKNHKNWAWPCALVLSMVLPACEDTNAPPGPPAPPKNYTYQLVAAYPGVKFTNAVDLRSAGDSRLFVVEQAGRIMVFDTASPGTPTVFLNIPGITSGGETGLLGLAFHPAYASNGFFFVNYTYMDMGFLTTRIARFTVSGDPDIADENSQAPLLDVRQVQANHNGGGLAFGEGGYLYVGLGDGGGAGDPEDTAQDNTRLLGKILCLDVDQNVSTPPYYGIPATNPFAASGSLRREIFAYGMRNPWRISYDAVAGRLWAGDVGQRAWEEVDVIMNGGNYGWDCREGAHVFVPTGGDDPPSPVCPVPGTIAPLWEYDHSGGNRSITGGYVYRGPTAASLTGKYIYADYSSGRIWALTVAGNTASDNELLIGPPASFAIATFGVGADGELYVARYGGAAELYRIEQADTTGP